MEQFLSIFPICKLGALWSYRKSSSLDLHQTTPDLPFPYSRASKHSLEQYESPTYHYADDLTNINLYPTFSEVLPPPIQDLFLNKFISDVLEPEDADEYSISPEYFRHAVPSAKCRHIRYLHCKQCIPSQPYESTSIYRAAHIPRRSFSRTKV